MKSKILFMSLLSVATFFASCKKDETTPSDSSVSQTSSNTSDLASARLSEFGLQTADSSEIRDSSGRPKPPCKITEVEVSALPGSVTSYISSNYGGATIEKAGTDQKGNYLVALKKADGTHAGLLFDAAGNFLKEKQLPPRPEMGKPVDIASLPSAISSYISSNYSGATIEKACVRQDGKYVVLVKKSDGKPTALAFDANGNFLVELPPPPKGPHGPRGLHGQQGPERQ